MKILAIDTSTDACSAALLINNVNDADNRDNNTILERNETKPRSHSQLLLPMIDSLIKEANIELSEVDAIAFGQGPGSFTGLRIAGSMVQGLSFGIQKPVIPISTLRAIAQGAYRQQRIRSAWVWLKARMNEVHWALFEIDNHGLMQRASEDQLQTMESMMDMMKMNMMNQNKDNNNHSKTSWTKITGHSEARDIAILAANEFKKAHFIQPHEIQIQY